MNDDTYRLRVMDEAGTWHNAGRRLNLAAAHAAMTRLVKARWRAVQLTHKGRQLSLWQRRGPRLERPDLP